MASLWWRWSQFSLTEAADGIGEMYTGIAQGLSGAGYTGVLQGERCAWI